MLSLNRNMCWSPFHVSKKRNHDNIASEKKREFNTKF